MSQPSAAAALRDSLLEAASARVGLDDYGDTAFLEGLDVLLESSLTEDGNTDFLNSSVGLHTFGALVGRLITEQSWKLAQGWQDMRITRPMIIAGLPRTATTTLQHLLCLDAANQGPEQWLLQSPQPRPPRESWESNPAFQGTDQNTKGVYALDPELESIHPTGAALPDEDWPLLQQSFTSNIFEILGVTVPTYSKWLAQADLTEAMGRHRRGLQLIGMTTPRRRWILKSPTHLHALSGLLAEYPDAMVVQTHRDPRTVIPSAASLIGRTKKVLGDNFDPVVFGASQLDVWARGNDAAMAARRAEPDQLRFFDIDVRDMAEDPLAVIRALYAYFALELGDDAVSNMQAWLAANHRHTSAGHRYRASDFGLTDAMIDERFAAYNEQFGFRG